MHYLRAINQPLPIHYVLVSFLLTLNKFSRTAGTLIQSFINIYLLGYVTWIIQATNKIIKRHETNFLSSRKNIKLVGNV